MRSAVRERIAFQGPDLAIELADMNQLWPLKQYGTLLGQLLDENHKQCTAATRQAVHGNTQTATRYVVAC
jgi:hypothetical protein